MNYSNTACTRPKFFAIIIPTACVLKDILLNKIITNLKNKRKKDRRMTLLDTLFISKLILKLYKERPFEFY